MAPFMAVLLAAATVLLLIHPAQHTACASTTTAADSMSKNRKQFHVFSHDQLNLTDFPVLKGLQGGAAKPASGFGSFFCVNDPVTASQDQTSALLGTYTSTAVAASLDGLTYINSFTLFFNTTNPSPGTPSHLLGLQGTLSGAGLLSLVHPQPQLILGGTGSFIFAQGTVTAVPVDVRTPAKALFRLELDVHWLI